MPDIKAMNGKAKKGLAPIEWHENIRQCTATAKSTGERCRCPAVTGFNVCKVHGAHKKRSPNDPPKKTKSGRHSNVLQKYKNKLNKTAEELDVDLSVGLKHGFLAFEVLNEAERQDFLSVVKQMHDDFQLNRSSDFYATELVATNLVLFRRAVKNDDVKSAEAYDRMVRMHLSDLKATKSAREGDTVNIKTTPAEWAASILERFESEEARDQAVHHSSGGDTSDECETSVAFDSGVEAKKPDETKSDFPRQSHLTTNTTLPNVDNDTDNVVEETHITE